MINEIWRRMGARWKASCVAISILLVPLLLAACVVPIVTPEPPTEAPAAAEPAGPRPGGTLVIAMDAEADILDNQAGGGWITWRVNRNMFDTLVMEDLTQEDVAIPPRIGGLAERWEVSDDGLEYTFYLRQGVKFHDGTDFNAEVVKWNVDRMWNEDAPQYSAKAASCTAFSWQALDSMEIVDDYTIKLVMSRPFGEFIGKLVDGGCGNTSLMSPTNWEQWGNDEIGEHPVGTGPFKFVERVRGEKIVLEKWDGYWGKELGGPYQEPYLDRLIFRPMPDPAARIAALEAGEVDMVWSPPPDSVEDMVKKGSTLSQGPTPHIWYWNLNLQEPCYDDIKVRQAINHAIDREGMARDLLRETVLPAYSMMVPGSRAFDLDLKIEYDLEKAKQLMAESSCPDGFTTKWLVPTGGSGNIIPVPMAEWIQRDLRAIGIDMELETRAEARKENVGRELRRLEAHVSASGASTPISGRCRTFGPLQASQRSDRGGRCFCARRARLGPLPASTVC